VCAALVNSVQQCVPLFILVAYYITFFSGFPMLLSHMHPVWKWATYPCFLRWAMQGMFRNQFSETAGYYDDDTDGDDGTLDVLGMYSYDTFGRMECLLFVGAITAMIMLMQLAILFVRRI
jgi:hypothetical protein